MYFNQPVNGVGQDVVGLPYKPPSVTPNAARLNHALKNMALVGNELEEVANLKGYPPPEVMSSAIEHWIIRLRNANAAYASAYRSAERKYGP